MAALVSGLMLCLSGSAFAQDIAAEQRPTVQSLYQDCKGPNYDYCNGYLLGVANALKKQRDYVPKWKEEYCPPVSANLSTYREIFLNWAEESESWERDGYDGVFLAFWVEYFCRN